MQLLFTKHTLVYAVPHLEFVTLNNYSEENFELLICEAREKVNQIQNEIETILKNENSIYEIPPLSQSSEETLVAPLSFKYAAVHARLGWIGKNGVLITRKYGPRVRLAAILIDFEFPISSPIFSSQCPSNCFKCVDACPHKALKGKQWDINTKRFEIIDFQLCIQKRKEYIKKHGRKHSCGFCMVSCPIGL